MTWPDYVLTKTVTGTYVNSSGQPAKGRVTFTPTSPITADGDLVISLDTLTAPLTTSGTFSISLPTTDNQLLTPHDWAYLVSVRLYGVKPLKYYIKLPYGDGQSIDISDTILHQTSPIQDATSHGSSIRGPVGPRGTSTLVGEGAPSNTLGNNDDIYIDVTTGSYYGPKENGSWPNSPFYTIGAVQTTRYVFNQASPSSTWNITHSLGGRPSVTVVDSAGTVVIGEVAYNSNTSVTVSFSAPFSGSAYLT